MLNNLFYKLKTWPDGTYGKINCISVLYIGIENVFDFKAEWFIAHVQSHCNTGLKTVFCRLGVTMTVRDDVCRITLSTSSGLQNRINSVFSLVELPLITFCLMGHYWAGTRVY